MVDAAANCALVVASSAMNLGRVRLFGNPDWAAAAAAAAVVTLTARSIPTMITRRTPLFLALAALALPAAAMEVRSR